MVPIDTEGKVPHPGLRFTYQSLLKYLKDIQNNALGFSKHPQSKVNYHMMLELYFTCKSNKFVYTFLDYSM